MVSVAERFGKNLRRCSKLADLPQEEAGQRASMNRTQIGVMKRGERLPCIVSLDRSKAFAACGSR